MYDVSDLEIFLGVVTRGSLTGCAKDLGLTTNVVSKRIHRLEAKLRARLFDRTTRRVIPTDIGMEFFRCVEPHVAAISEAQESLVSRSKQAKGTLRVTAPSSFGRLHIVPHLPGFFARYPDIVLNLELSDVFEDILAERYDLAIRIGSLPDSAFGVRRLSDVNSVLCARADYLDRYGRPRSLSDLRNHACLATENQAPWKLIGPDGPLTLHPKSQIRTHSNEVVRKAVIAGLGIGLRSTWDIRQELDNGMLEIVLTGCTAQNKASIYGVFPSRRFVPLKIRVFLDFLARLYRPTIGIDGTSVSEHSEKTLSLRWFSNENASAGKPRPSKRRKGI